MARSPVKTASTETIFALVAVLLTASFLRFQLLGADVRFHPDEAFFAAFARNAAVRGEWLLPGDLDKTPLAIYTQAVGMLAFGIQWDGAVWRLDVRQGEFAARLITAYQSVLLVAASAKFAAVLRISRPQRVMVAAWVALSPYTVAFSATAFTDTPMLLFAVLALINAYHGRRVTAGLWIVAAYAAKQQALLLVPLVILGLWRVHRLRGWWRFILAIGLGAALLFAWDAARPYPAGWQLATANNAPDGLLIPVNDLWPRLYEWGTLAGLLFGMVGTPVMVALGLWGGRNTHQITADGQKRISVTADGQKPVPTTIGWLWVYIGGYALLHLLVPLRIYDRYLLPLVPLIAIGVADGIRSCPQKVLAVVATLLMIPAAWNAATVHPTLGGDKGDHDGIIALADDLNGHEFGAIIYDRWLGWELNYYLGAWTDKRRAYYPTPWHMVIDPALYVPDVAPRYLPAPADTNLLIWRGMLGLAGFQSCIYTPSTHFQVIIFTRPQPQSAYSTWKMSCHNGLNRLE